MPGEVRVLGVMMASVMMEGVNVGVGGAMMLGLLLCFCWRNSMKAAAMVGSVGLVAKSVRREA